MYIKKPTYHIRASSKEKDTSYNIEEIPIKRLTTLMAINNKPPKRSIRPLSFLNCSQRSFFSASLIQKTDLEKAYAKTPTSSNNTSEI